MATHPSTIDWDLAERVAIRVAERAPFAHAHERVDLVADFEQHTALAERLVAETTGLVPLHGAARARVVDRAAWIRANLASLQRLLRPMLERMADRPPGLLAPFATRISGAELGAVLGWMSTRVLGQYDLLVLEDEDAEDQDLVYYVGPNVVAIERRYAFPPDDFRLWLALHEVTHRAQFTGVPWMREHYLGLVETLLDVDLDDEEDGITDRLRNLANRRRHADDEAGRAAGAGLLEAVAGPEQQAALDRIAGLMSLLEGHGDVTMDRAGEGHVRGADRFARVMRERRRSATGLVRLLQKVIGLEAKLAQYAQGEAFIAAVEAEGGTVLLDRAWDDPGNLPDRAEIAEPSRWIERMAALAV
ncbi:MAG: zinc-dependent metalloprotease [Acidimicrobiales bacterium]|nr:zinc-dependent metalloprotease [Acidimicrobiales bacterium]